MGSQEFKSFSVASNIMNAFTAVAEKDYIYMFGYTDFSLNLIWKIDTCNFLYNITYRYLIIMIFNQLLCFVFIYYEPYNSVLCVKSIIWLLPFSRYFTTVPIIFINQLIRSTYLYENILQAIDQRGRVTRICMRVRAISE